MAKQGKETQFTISDKEEELVKQALSELSTSPLGKKLVLPDVIPLAATVGIPGGSSDPPSSHRVQGQQQSGNSAKWNFSTRILRSRRKLYNRDKSSRERNGASALEVSLAELEERSFQQRRKPPRSSHRSLITESRTLVGDDSSTTIIDSRLGPKSVSIRKEKEREKEREREKEEKVKVKARGKVKTAGEEEEEEYGERARKKKKQRRRSIVNVDYVKVGVDGKSKESRQPEVGVEMEVEVEKDGTDHVVAQNVSSFDADNEAIIEEINMNKIVDRYMESCRRSNVRPLPSLSGVCRGVARTIADHQRRIREAEEEAVEAEALVEKMLREERGRLQGTTVARRWKQAARRASVEAGPLMGGSSLGEAGSHKLAKPLSIADMAFQARLEDGARKRVEARLREELGAVSNGHRKKLIRAGLHVMAPQVKSGLKIVLRNSQIGPFHASALADCLLISFKEGVDIASFRSDGAFFGRRGFRALAEVIMLQRRLKVLNIANTGLTSEDAPTVAQLLCGRASLSVVDISENSIGDKGMGFIAEALVKSVEGTNNAGRISKKVEVQIEEVKARRAKSKGKEGRRKLVMHVAAADTSENAAAVAAGGGGGEGGAQLMLPRAESNKKFEIWKLGTPQASGREGGHSFDDDHDHHVDDVMDIPGEALQPTRCAFKHLTLSHMGLGSTARGATYLMLVLACANNLRHLDLAWNKIGRDSVALLAKGIARHPSLEEVNLSWNAIDDEGAMELSLAMEHCKSLKCLDVAHNRIGPRGAMVLCSCAAEREDADPLHTLKLDQNPIGKIGGRSVVFAMKTVEKVTIAGCNISSQTLEEMEEDGTLFDPTQPEGVYSLDLTDPYERAVARELMVAARRDKRGEWSNESINGSTFRLPLYAAFQLPLSGTLRLVFRQTSTNNNSQSSIVLDDDHFQRIIGVLDVLSWETSTSSTVIGVLCNGFTFTSSQCIALLPALLELSTVEKVKWLCRMVGRISDRKNISHAIGQMKRATPGLSKEDLLKVASAGRIHLSPHFFDDDDDYGEDHAGLGHHHDEHGQMPLSPGRFIASRVKAQQAAHQKEVSSDFLTVVSNAQRPHRLRSPIAGSDFQGDRVRLKTIERKEASPAPEPLSLQVTVHDANEGDDSQDDASLSWSIENPTGHFYLDFANETDRDTFKTLLKLARDECHTARVKMMRPVWAAYHLCKCKHCAKADSSQYGNSLPQFRNVTFNGQFLVLDYTWVGWPRSWLHDVLDANAELPDVSTFMVPTAGTITFDYVETLAKHEGKQGLSFFDFEEMLRSIKVMGGSVPQGALEAQRRHADDKRVAYIKSVVNAQYFLCSQVFRLVFEGLTTWKARETITVALFRCVVDPQNFMYEAARFEEDGSSEYKTYIANVQRRIGPLHVMFPRRPDRYYKLDLSIRDERCVANMLASLGGLDTAINWVDATLDGKSIALTTQWTNEGIPKHVGGTLELSFMTSTTFELKLESPRGKAKKRMAMINSAAKVVGIMSSASKQDASVEQDMDEDSSSDSSDGEGVVKSGSEQDYHGLPKEHIKALAKRREEFDEFFKSVMSRNAPSIASKSGMKQVRHLQVDEHEKSVAKTKAKAKHAGGKHGGDLHINVGKHGRGEDESPTSSRSNRKRVRGLFKAAIALAREGAAARSEEGDRVRATLASLARNTKRMADIASSSPSPTHY